VASISVVGLKKKLRSLSTVGSLEILSGIRSLARAEFWNCDGLTNAGIARLVQLPNLQELTLDGLRGVTKEVPALFPAHVRVKYS